MGYDWRRLSLRERDVLIQRAVFGSRIHRFKGEFFYHHHDTSNIGPITIAELIPVPRYTKDPSDTVSLMDRVNETYRLEMVTTTLADGTRGYRFSLRTGDGVDNRLVTSEGGTVQEAFLNCLLESIGVNLSGDASDEGNRV